VQTLVYNGVTVWEHVVTVVYSKACANQKISEEPTFTLTTASPRPIYTAGTYTYTLKIPYQKTISDTFSTQAYLAPVVKDASGNTIKSWSNQMINGTKGTDVRYMTLNWTSTTWLGNAEKYSVQIDRSGGNSNNVKYPSGYNITLTATNA